MTIKRVIIDAGRPVKLWTDDIEAEAEQQLRNIAGLPFIYHHVAVMPDVHFGKGATVGSVIATRSAVVPAAVGVDIGCGMMAARTDLTSADFRDGDLATLRHSIERGVPVGFNAHKEPSYSAHAWIQKRRDECGAETVDIVSTKHLCQLGTLGGGNHFIELCVDGEDRVWIMLHSGSRNLGKVLADEYIGKAQRIAERYFIPLADPDLAYLAHGAQEFDDYLRDLNLAQDYAMENRRLMMAEIQRSLVHFFGKRGRNVAFFDEVNCHHNYLAIEHHFGENVYVTRKGAIRAREGDMGIIPGSMGTRSFIVRGKGNPESFMSSSHGAGRRMSRNKARAMFTEADLAAQTAGVECRKDAGVIDEIPAAYKSIDEVMANQADLVEVVATLKQVLCVKG